MGWKASCVFVAKGKSAFLESFPSHDEGDAERILAVLGREDYELVEDSDFEEGVNPADDSMFLGCYPRGYLIADWNIASACVEGGNDELVRRVCDLVPDGYVLAIILGSVTNLFGYAYFERGERLRARGGSADEGTFVDAGEPLSEERPLFERSEMRDGERIFVEEIQGERQEFTEAAFGEEFVFELSKMALGCRLDAYDGWELSMQRFRKKRKGLLGRLFG